VFFFSPTGFLGQLKCSSIVNKIIKFDIIENEKADGGVSYLIKQ
jgi:hypothetical protein